MTVTDDVPQTLSCVHTNNSPNCLSLQLDQSTSLCQGYVVFELLTGQAEASFVVVDNSLAFPIVLHKVITILLITNFNQFLMVSIFPYV